MRTIVGFPDPVNETSARVVATGVVLLAAAFLVTGEGWLLALLVYGFAARVVTGPTLSPLGQLATRVVTPAIERIGVTSRHVSGPPKRFAQAVGLAFSSGAAVAWFAGLPVLTYALVTMLVVAASLEAAFAICLGCIVYNAIWGCADCADVSDRLRTAIAESRRTAERPAAATN